PLTMSGKHLQRYAGLSGISLPQVESRVDKQTFQAGMLFTHRGVSGPAILQISSYWQPGDDLRVDLLPTLAADWLSGQRQRRPNAELKTVLAEVLPRRLAECLCQYWFRSRPMRRL